MSHAVLPKHTADVLHVPPSDIPEVIRSLVQRRELSRLVHDIHTELDSTDPSLRDAARLALSRLGFAE